MAAKEIILCEALIDALTFWCAGYRNVTSAYGIEGFTDEMLDAFRRHGTQRVLIAYDIRRRRKVPITSYGGNGFRSATPPGHWR